MARVKRPGVLDGRKTRKARQKLHRCPVLFLGVAWLARRDDVFDEIRPSPRKGDHMLTGQCSYHRRVAQAVGTMMPEVVQSVFPLLDRMGPFCFSLPCPVVCAVSAVGRWVFSSMHAPIFKSIFRVTLPTEASILAHHGSIFGVCCISLAILLTDRIAVFVISGHLICGVFNSSLRLGLCLPLLGLFRMGLLICSSRRNLIFLVSEVPVVACNLGTRSAL